MTKAQDPVSFPTDPYPVRPGTSAALTARTIDATVHPPLVRAQEKVADLVPRVTASLSDPVLLVSLAGTLVLMWLAVRMRSRLAPVLLSAMLMMTLTSFRPAGSDDGASPPEPEPSPSLFEAPEVHEAPEPPPQRNPRYARHAHPDERSLGSQLLESFPEVMIVAKMNAEVLVQQLNEEFDIRDERELRAYVKQLKRRLRAEARRMARDR